MPIWDGTTTPKSELLLTDPSNKRKKDESVQQGIGLDNEIRFHSTVLNAMDGDKIYRSSIDEAGKFPKETPFDQYWRIVKTSHRQGGYGLSSINLILKDCVQILSEPSTAF